MIWLGSMASMLLPADQETLSGRHKALFSDYSYL